MVRANVTFEHWKTVEFSTFWSQKVMKTFWSQKVMENVHMNCDIMQCCCSQQTSGKGNAEELNVM